MVCFFFPPQEYFDHLHFLPHWILVSPSTTCTGSLPPHWPPCSSRCGPLPQGEHQSSPAPLWTSEHPTAPKARLTGSVSLTAPTVSLNFAAEPPLKAWHGPDKIFARVLKAWSQVQKHRPAFWSGITPTAQVTNCKVEFTTAAMCPRALSNHRPCLQRHSTALFISPSYLWVFSQEQCWTISLGFSSTVFTLWCSSKNASKVVTRIFQEGFFRWRITSLLTSLKEKKRVYRQTIRKWKKNLKLHFWPFKAMNWERMNKPLRQKTKQSFNIVKSRKISFFQAFVCKIFHCN